MIVIASKKKKKKNNKKDDIKNKLRSYWKLVYPKDYVDAWLPA